jgi:hypothetical protein
LAFSEIVRFAIEELGAPAARSDWLHVLANLPEN